MPAKFQKNGIVFQYPENWKLAEDQADDWPRTVSVQSPSGAFWSIHVYPPDGDAESLAAELVETMRKEYEIFESEKLTSEIDGQPAVGFQMEFYCLDFLVTAQVIATSSPTGVCLHFYQAESREFDEMLPVFQALSISFARSSKFDFA